MIQNQLDTVPSINTTKFTKYHILRNKIPSAFSRLHANMEIMCRVKIAVWTFFVHGSTKNYSDVLLNF